MPVLINTKSLITDVWHRYVGSADSLPYRQPCLLPIEEWIEHPLIWREFASDVGVILAPSDDPTRLVERLNELTIIAMEFVTASDGLGIKHAAQLREEFDYRGTIRALGQLTAEQISPLIKAGFSEFEMVSESEATAALSVLQDRRSKVNLSDEGISPNQASG